jgi:hypothetical protein
VPAGFLSVRDAASIIGATPPKLARWRREGIGPIWSLIGVRPVYSEVDLRRWLRPISPHTHHHSGLRRSAAPHGAREPDTRTTPARVVAQAALPAISRVRTNVMPNQKRPTTLTDGTPIQKLAALLPSFEQVSGALGRMHDNAAANRRFHRLCEKEDGLKRQICALAPQNIKDAAILAALMLPDPLDEEHECWVAFLSLVQVLANSACLDLRDIGHDGELLIPEFRGDIFLQRDEGVAA